MPLLDALTNIYGNGGAGDPLIGIGMGLLSRRGGEGLAQGFQNVAATAELANQRKRQGLQDQLLTAQVAKSLRPEYGTITNPLTGQTSFFDKTNPGTGATVIPGQPTPTAPTFGKTPAGTEYVLGPNGQPHFAPASTVINNQPAKPTQVFDLMKDRADEARSVAGSLPAFGQAKALLDSGNMITGAGADTRMQMQKIGALFGLDASAAENSEVFRSTVAPTVLSMVKGLGAGSGISNADREFAEKAAGGNVNLEPGSIRRLMDIGERAAKYKLDQYNKTFNSVYPDTPDNAQTRALFGVQAPDYTPQPQGSQPQPNPSGAVNTNPPIGPQKQPGKVAPAPAGELEKAREIIRLNPGMKPKVMNYFMQNGFDTSGL